MDDRTGGVALGAMFLVRASGLRARSAAERALYANLRREVDRIGHTWVGRLSNVSAAAGGTLGVLIPLDDDRASLADPAPSEFTTA